MIRKGDENPYLRGKPPKVYITASFAEMANPFGGLTDDQRITTVAQVAKHHADNFSSALARLDEICRTYNFFQLLAHFAYYDQLLLDHANEDAAYSPIEQNAAELLQAFILRIPEADLQLSLDSPPPPEILLEVNKLLGGLNTSFSLKRFASSEAKRQANLLCEMMRGHTASVRNEGFPTQLRQLVSHLVAPLDPEFETRQGVRLTSIATMLWNVATLIETRINEDFRDRQLVLSKKHRSDVVNAFFKHHRADRELAAAVSRDIQNRNPSLHELRGYLINVWDRANYRFFVLSPEELIAAFPDEVNASVIQRLVRAWEIPLGDLADHDPEHLFLDNPVWSRPMIRFGPKHLLLPLPGLIQSFGLRLIETLIKLEPDLWDKYLSKVRPKHLENRVEKLLSAALPNAQIIAGARWRDTEMTRVYETDLLIIQDTHALIIESKAGRISGRARRGDAVRLRKEVEKLIAEPTLQSNRFAEYLSNASGPILLET